MRPFPSGVLLVSEKGKVKVAQLCQAHCDLLVCTPWNSPGQNTGVDYFKLIFHEILFLDLTGVCVLVCLCDGWERKRETDSGSWSCKNKVWYWVAYTQQTFISDCSGGWKSVITVAAWPGSREALCQVAGWHLISSHGRKRSNELRSPLWRHWFHA